MKKTPPLVVLFALLAFASPLAQSVHSLGKPKETKAESKSLSPGEIREFNKKIEWIQKNSSEIDRRMFDLGSKQFDVSWTIWYSWYLLGGLLVALGGLIYGILYRVLKSRVENAAKEKMEEEGLFLKTIIHTNTCYLALMHADAHGDQLREKFLELGITIADDSHKRAQELIDLVRTKGTLEENNPQFKKYKAALATAQSNLAWARSQKANPTDADKRVARQLAKAFYDFAVSSDEYHEIDTYAWVLILCGVDENEKKRGREILRDLIAREDLPPSWREGRLKAFRERFNQDP